MSAQDYDLGRQDGRYSQERALRENIEELEKCRALFRELLVELLDPEKDIENLEVVLRYRPRVEALAHARPSHT